MAELFLYLPEDLSSPWDWFLSGTSESGQAVTTQQKNELVSLGHAKLIAVIAGTQVTTKIHTLGKLNQKQLQQAAGFSIEEELAVSLENTHLAFSNHENRLAIISKPVLADLLAELSKCGLSPDVIFADYESIKAGEDYLLNGHVISASDDGSGYTIDANLLPHFKAEGKPQPIPISPISFLQKVSDAYLAEHGAINLRQGEFKKNAGFSTGRLKRSIWLAVACATLFVGVNLGQGFYYQHKTKAVHAKINDMYMQIFPDTPIPKKPVLSVLKAQSKQKVTQGDGFIELSAILAKSVQDVEGIELVSLGYDKGRSQISLSVIYKSFDDVERLKSAVARHGGSFTESGTRQSNAGLVGDAILRVAS